MLLEAMAMGIPWVSFDVGNVKDHVGGFVVSSLTEMKDKIELLLSDKVLYKRMSDEGRKRILEKHDWDVITKKYEEQYWKLLN